MDRTGANFLSVVEQIRERLGHNAIAMQLPIGAEDNFTGIIDLVNNVAHMFTDDMGTYDEEPIPADYAELAAEYREKLVEAAAETDEELMMKYLEGEELTVEEIKGAVRKATCEVKMIPVFCGSAFKNKRVQMLLDAIIDYCPAPTDIPAIKGTLEDGEETERHASDSEPFSALAFKIMTDPYVGKLTFFRVYSGTLAAGTYVLNSTKNKRERIGRILQMHANHREEIDMVYAGDIAAAVGLKDTGTGDTLCAEDSPIILESMEFPEPVINIAIEPSTKS